MLATQNLNPHLFRHGVQTLRGVGRRLESRMGARVVILLVQGYRITASTRLHALKHTRIILDRRQYGPFSLLNVLVKADFDGSVSRYRAGAGTRRLLETGKPGFRCTKHGVVNRPALSIRPTKGLYLSNAMFCHSCILHRRRMSQAT